MGEISFAIKNLVIKNIYKPYKKILFLQDPEKVHNSFINFGKKLSKNEAAKKTISFLFGYQHPSLEQEIFKIKFKNPVGLSAGFDKNAELTDITPSFGFGFIEVGSITAKPYLGNAGLRLKRIVEKKSLFVNYGLKSKGVSEVKKTLLKKNIEIPLGINIAKTNCKETCIPKIGIEDYITTLKEMKEIGDYFVLNISCPNAYGGQPFTEPELYEALLKKVSQLKIKKPILVKLSPDLNKKNIDALLKISYRYKISGFTCTNITKLGIKRSGGFSGKLVEKKSNEILAYVYKKTKQQNKNYLIIGVGGIFSAEDAYKKIKLGANLVQLITGIIYQGPQLVSEINQGLVKFLKRDGFSNISQAVGTANK